MTVGHRSAWPAGASWLLGAAIAIVAVVGVVSAAYVVQSNAGSASGVESGSAYLSHWQQTAVISSTTPTRIPAALSATVGAPTRLAAAGSSYALDAATAGHLAVEWVFTEATGIAPNLELEISYSVEYAAGGTTHTASGTVYVETQATAPGANIVFDIYWDGGAAAGLTFGAETEISQVCASVGSCP